MLPLSSGLVAASGLVLLAMGSYHLLLTFRGPAFHPRDESVRAAMESASPRLSSTVSMWNAWIGFNASHSFGAMLFGLVYGYMAIVEPATLFGSVFLQLVGLALLSAYCAVAARYWFRAPLRGVLFSTTMYVTALAVRWM